MSPWQRDQLTERIAAMRRNLHHCKNRMVLLAGQDRVPGAIQQFKDEAKLLVMLEDAIEAMEAELRFETEQAA